MLAQAPGSENRLDEIVVTATRRERQLRSVPLSVGVVTKDELDRLGALGFADYAGNVPGLAFTDGGSTGEKQTIRGISSNAWFEVNNGTAVHLNEVPITTAGGPIGPSFNPDPVLVDISRIEVLRGPQGTLFGAGSMGGAIRIITNDPDPDNFGSEVQTMFTSTENGEPGYALHGVMNVPIGDGRGAIRAVAFQGDLGGYIDNTTDGRDDVNNRKYRGARISTAYQLTENASVTASVMYQDRDSDGTSHEETNLGRRTQSRNPESIGDEWTSYNVVVDVDFDWGSLLSSTSYFDRNVDNAVDVSVFLSLFFGLDIPLTAVNGDETGQFVQELRLVSDSDRQLSWLAGAFYQDQHQDIRQDFPSPGFDALTGGLASMFGPPDNLFVRRESFVLEQSALYGELSYRFTDRLELSAGGRWYHIDRDYSADNLGLLFVMGQVQESFAANESGFIPSFAINYTASERLSMYGIVSAGFRPGGINSPGAFMEPTCAQELAALGYVTAPTSYESDNLLNYEAGTRFVTAAGRTQFDVAVYHIDWSDMQTSTFLNCGVGFFDNAGEATSDGIEFEVSSTPVDQLRYSIAASYTVAELSEDVPNVGGIEGDRLPGVPKLTARASASYDFPAYRNKIPSAAIDVRYVGGSYMEFNRAASPVLPSYTVAGIRFGLASENWSASLFVRNLFDESGILFSNDNVLGQWVTSIRPRTIGLSLNWRF